MKSLSSSSSSGALLLAAAVAAGASFLACSAGSSSAPSAPVLGAHVGGIEMKLANIPADIQCVELDTSDVRTPQVRVDVSPGTSVTIPVAPLDPGYVWLSGEAYDQSCESLAYGGYDDGGVTTQGDVTWVADGVSLDIIAGQYTQTDLHFHQLGGATVNIEWDTCDGGGGNFYYCGGEDGGPPADDASPPPLSDDAGAVTTIDAGSTTAVPLSRAIVTK